MGASRLIGIILAVIIAASRAPAPDFWFLFRPARRAPSRMTSPPLFWLFAFVLALAVLVALVWPLLRQRRSDAPGDEAAATAVFRDHKRQLDEEVASGTLSTADRDAAESELVARFGSELAAAPAETVVASERSRWIAAMVLVALVPASAALVYVYLGNPSAINAPPAPAATAESTITDPQIVAMVDRLAEKMKANPEDGKGWVLLGRSYLKMGRYDDSAAAFAEAAKHMPESAGLLTDQAEAVAMAQGQRLAGRPAELLKRALVLEPEYPKAMAMSAAAASERGDYATAIALWKKLKSLVPPNSEQSQQIDEVLAELEAQRKGGPAPAVTAAVTPSAKAPVVAPPAKAAAVTPPAQTAAPASGAVAGASVGGRVEIDAKLAGKFAPGDALFIYARDPDGSRMPLAVLRTTAAELPKSFALTDAMAMAPNMTISRAKNVVVEARISKSGNAIPQSGDLRGTSAPVQPGAAKVRIVIDQVVP
jgi:cytochrome c-type biogenesis protein CcmH